MKRNPYCALCALEFRDGDRSEPLADGAKAHLCAACVSRLEARRP